MIRHYILGGKDGRQVIPVDMMTWATWLNTGDRVVGRDVIGPFKVSTVFLGLDHGYRIAAPGELPYPPVLWESMIFTDTCGGPLNNEQDRCSGTWEQAEAMHRRMCDKAREYLANHPELKYETFSDETYRATIKDSMRKGREALRKLKEKSGEDTSEA